MAFFCQTTRSTTPLPEDTTTTAGEYCFPIILAPNNSGGGVVNNPTMNADDHHDQPTCPTEQDYDDDDDDVHHHHSNPYLELEEDDDDDNHHDTTLHPPPPEMEAPDDSWNADRQHHLDDNHNDNDNDNHKTEDDRPESRTITALHHDSDNDNDDDNPNDDDDEKKVDNDPHQAATASRRLDSNSTTKSPSPRRVGLLPSKPTPTTFHHQNHPTTQAHQNHPLTTTKTKKKNKALSLSTMDEMRSRSYLSSTSSATTNNSTDSTNNNQNSHSSINNNNNNSSSNISVRTVRRTGGGAVLRSADFSRRNNNPTTITTTTMTMASNNPNQNHQSTPTRTNGPAGAMGGASFWGQAGGASLSSSPPSRGGGGGWDTIWERVSAGTRGNHWHHVLSQWVSLPTIAVIGDTSSGKSSVLSQLAGFDSSSSSLLPRGPEITTLCPIELQMRHSPHHQQATIDIHWKNNHHSSSASSPNGRGRQRWEPCILLTPEEWNEIPTIVQQAQDVILRQQQQQQEQKERQEQEQYRSEYLSADVSDPSESDISCPSSSSNNNNHNNRNTTKTKSTAVASDVISLVLTGPMYPPQQQTLTLIDLPGLVPGRHNAVTESSTVSDEIVHVLHPYLCNPHCLLVTIVPANVDYHNCHALKLVSEYDPLGQRTCLVWTKPDLIDPGAERIVAGWMQQAPEMFHCPVVHMVKCRGAAANHPTTTIDHSPAKADDDDEEEDYFATTAPWNEMDPTLFGTRQLRSKLVQFQTQLVQQSLPQVYEELWQQYTETKQELQQLLCSSKPLESETERRQYYQQICQDLIQTLQSSFSGKQPTVVSPPAKQFVSNRRMMAMGATATRPSLLWKARSPPNPTSTTTQIRPTTRMSSMLTEGKTTTLPQQHPPPPPPPPPSSAFLSPPPVGNQPTNAETDETGNNKNESHSLSSAASRLHQACHKFTAQIQKQGSLATVRTIVEGAQVLVTSAQGTVRGEVVHLQQPNQEQEEEGYCCVDTYSRDAATADAITQRVLFENFGQALPQQPQEQRSLTKQALERHVNDINDDDDDDDDDTEIPCMEENDVWSDGNRVLIARAGGRTYDTLRKIPLDCVWTDPTSWLQAHMERYRTDDLPCFLNVESFAHIVQQFMHQDWTPACQELLQNCETIVQETMTAALNQALPKQEVQPLSSSSPSSLYNATTKTTSNIPSSGENSRHKVSASSSSPRYPGLRQLLHRHLRQVADTLLTEATQQVESHLAMEAHPFTQDEELFAKMNQARYSRLKRELEIALLSELEQQQQRLVADNAAKSNSWMNRYSAQEQHIQQQGLVVHHQPSQNHQNSHIHKIAPELSWNVRTTGANGRGRGGVVMEEDSSVVGVMDDLHSSHNGSSSVVDVVPGVLDTVFARHEQMSATEHLAFEMELVLESYGTIATRRVLDRTPMICWHVFRSFASLLANQLATVTDSELSSALVEPNNEFTERYRTLQEKCDELYEAIQVLEENV